MRDRRNLQEAVVRRIAIVGLPNTGKSQLYNELTGQYTLVANYPLTTVEPKSGPMSYRGERYQIIDTPGLHSAYIHSEEEIAVRELLFGDPPDGLIQCVDANRLKQSLLLTLDLLALGLPLVLCLTAVEETERQGLRIDARRLARRLGVELVEHNAALNRGVEEIKAAMARMRPAEWKPAYGEQVERALARLQEALPASVHFPRLKALLLLDRDPQVAQELRAEGGVTPELRERVRRLRRESRAGWSRLLGRKRAQLVEGIVAEVTTREPGTGGRAATAVARLCRHPLFGLPILAGIVAVLYLLVVRVAGLIQSLLTSWVVVPVVRAVGQAVPAGFWQELLIGDFGLLTLGIFNALVTVLPILSVFFLVLGLLEDIGYLPNLVVLTQRLLKGIGLSGRSVLSLVLGFGCKTMATLTVRGIPSRKERLITVYLIAFAIPCSAQLGISMAILGRVGLPAFLIAFAFLALVEVAAGWVLHRLLPEEAAGGFHPGAAPHPGAQAGGGAEKDRLPPVLVPEGGPADLPGGRRGAVPGGQERAARPAAAGPEAGGGGLAGAPAEHGRGADPDHGPPRGGRGADLQPGEPGGVKLYSVHRGGDHHHHVRALFRQHRGHVPPGGSARRGPDHPGHQPLLLPAGGGAELVAAAPEGGLMENERIKEEYLEVLWRMKEESDASLAHFREQLREEFRPQLLEELAAAGIMELEAERIRLTASGSEHTRKLIRSHRLAERLVHDVLGVEYEKGACEFEHILNPDLVDSICTLLGHPRECPHGMPIPEGECCRQGTQAVESSVVQPARAARRGAGARGLRLRFQRPAAAPPGQPAPAPRGADQAAPAAPLFRAGVRRVADRRRRPGGRQHPRLGEPADPTQAGPPRPAGAAPGRREVMKRILVAFSTNAGSTAEVAEAIRKGLEGPEAAVETRRLEEVRDLGGYAAVVLGGPMIVGWHRRTARFLRVRRRELARVPVALFFTAMQVTRAGGEQDHGFPVLLDPRLLTEPARPGRLSFKERHTTVESYLRPVRAALAEVRPVSAAFFAGKLDYGKLSFLHMLFVMLIIGATPGDSRNWELIGSWARDIRKELL